MKRMTSPSLLAFGVSLAAILAAAWVGWRVYENIPHIEDEMAFVWQARLAAAGELALPSPPHPNQLMTPFVVDFHGQRFGKYPPGWPVLLSFGIRWGLRAWVNPLLAGLAVWLTYRLGQKLFSATVGLLAAALTFSSPIFLLLSGSLLSHPWSLVLTLAFVLAWLDLTRPQEQDPKRGLQPTAENRLRYPGESRLKSAIQKMTVLAAGLSLGVLALTRPLTAVGAGLPFFVHGIILLGRGDSRIRKRVLAVGVISALTASLFFAWQYAATGDALTNPYTLWWPYDKLGFGPGYGNTASGHSWYWVKRNTTEALQSLWENLFGWGRVSWLFLPFGLWAAWKNRRAWPVAGIFPSLVAGYTLYWISTNLYGPRYYFESLPALTLLTAAGIDWLWRQAAPVTRRPGLFRLALGGLLLFLLGYNLIAFLPRRFAEMTGLYGVTGEQLRRFETPEMQAYTPALVIVHFDQTWTEYGGLLDLQDPGLTTPFIFALSGGEAVDRSLAQSFPDRRVLHYYPARGEIRAGGP